MAELNRKDVRKDEGLTTADLAGNGRSPEPESRPQLVRNAPGIEVEEEISEAKREVHQPARGHSINKRAS